MGSAALVRALMTPATPAPLPDTFTRLDAQLVNGLPTSIDLDDELSLAIVVPNGVAVTWRDADPTAIVIQSGPDVRPHRHADPNLARPTGVTATASIGGGGLTSGAYRYEITAMGAKGESLPSNPANAQLNALGKVTLAWTAVSGANAYRVYRTADAGGPTVFFGVRNNVFSDTGVGGRTGQAPTPPAPIGAVERPPVRLFLQQRASRRAAVPLVAGLQRVIPDGGDGAGGAVIELALLGWDIRAGSLRGSGDFGSRLEFAWRRADKAANVFEPPPLAPRVAQRLEPELRMQSLLGLDKSAGGTSE